MQLSLLLLSAIAGNAIAAPVLGGSVNEGKIVDSVIDPVVNTANGAVDDVLEKKRGLDRRLIDNTVDVGQSIDDAVYTVKETADGALERRLVDGKVDLGQTVDDAVYTVKNTADGVLERRALGGSVPVGGTVDSVVNPTVDAANDAVDDVLERRA